MTSTPNPRLVLIIDDDEVDRRRIVRWIGQQYAVCEAATARVGLDMARRLRPGCVLLDYSLSDADGLEVLAELVRGDCSVVLLTGHGGEEVAVQAFRAGATDYLIKASVGRQLLLAAIATASASSAARHGSGEPSTETESFAALASEFLRPRLAKVEASCRAAVALHPDVGGTLTEAFTELAAVEEQIAGLAVFARVDQLCEGVKTVDLAEVMASVEDDLAGTPDLPDVGLEVGQLPIVRGAPAGLKHVLHELVHGAMARSAEGGGREVSVAADLVNNMWNVRVQDQGAPPTPAELSREVFLPYRCANGRELALAVIAMVVRRHGGDTWIEPAESGGSRVIFSLPFNH